ncbi:hypothetical protein V7182_23135 [Neobacillus drentensis]|uniref:hypothetical protein n=1 Tax=Neobacillus drentensis TaxID=220684 RepID=UPI002FFEA068
MNVNKGYKRPEVLSHQLIHFETSQSWNEGHGPISGDYGNSDGRNYPNDAYDPKKPRPPSKPPDKPPYKPN